VINIKDINYAPNISEISSYIENPIFDEFYQYMNDKYKAVCKIEYSKDVWARGWNVKFRKSGKSLCVIYPKKNYFTVLVVVGNKEKERVENLLPRLSEYIQEIYHNTREGNGQKWLMIDLNSKDNAYQDVLRLVDIRYALKGINP